MADPKDTTADDEKAKKAKADKAAADKAAEKAAAEPQVPVPGQEEADEIKERVLGGETREAKAQTTSSANYKTR